MVKLLLGQLSGYPPDGWDRKWVICPDIEMVKLLLGQLSGYPPDGWDRRVKAWHWITRSWPLRNVLVQEEYNVPIEPLVDRNNIISSSE
ncbi:hypothetical protein QE152_g24777 [Popillia japonica]|uniref:Uncharacterized protein n=1 Tax=Popillia japonica TaxID=7064 RepID=A0AAW1K467_POPJA